MRPATRKRSRDLQTYDKLLTESRKLLKAWIYEVRKLAAELVPQQDAKLSRRDKAVLRWEIFLCVLMADMGKAIVELAPHMLGRPISVMNRCIYEYTQKGKYFLTNRVAAWDQYNSFDARLFATVHKMRHPSVTQIHHFINRYLEWKRDHEELNEFSGNAGPLTMHLATTKQEKLTDKNGKAYTWEYHVAYDVPSLYAHGEIAMGQDVFPEFDDLDSWKYREHSEFADTLAQVNLASVWMGEFVTAAAMHYKMRDLVMRYPKLTKRTRELTTAARVLKPQSC